MKSTEKTKPKLLVLLDSHAIIHRAYHALPDFASSKGEPTGALYGLSTMLLNIVKQFKPDYVVAAFDLPGPTYRHEAYKDYKAGRKKTDDELSIQLSRARDIFTAFNIPIYDMPGFEADDMLGTIVEKLKDDPDIDIIIASGDMDTMQLISGKKVKVFTLKKGIKDTVTYDEKAVKERFGFAPEFLPDYKGLRGDTSDNIIGIKGIGEKTATTLISEYHTIEKMYKALKKDKGEVMKKCGISPRIADLLLENEEDAEFSKALATIRKDAPIDFKLPEKTFKESVDYKEVEKLFNELEFRAIKERVKEVLGIAGTGGDVSLEKPEEVVDIQYDSKLFEETSIMRWVVDSNFPSPNTDEILAFTKAKTLPEAHEILSKELVKRGLVKVWEEIEKPLIPVLHDMKITGIKLDLDYLEKLGKTYHTELSKLEKSIWECAGEEFNINSPKQMGEILFVKMGLKAKRQKKTSTGAFSTKESELQKIKDLHPIIGMILEYRELQKLLSTYIDVLPTLTDKSGRLHTQFLQQGAVTGRMSSQHPNLQNIPNKTELGRNIRRAFITDPGFKIVAIDYSQIELRIAAFLSKDEKLLEIFRNGEDVHTSVASRVFNVPPEKVDKEMRRKAKVINFGILYGMGVSALKENLGGTREEAQEFYNAYFETFKGISAYLNQVKSDTERLGYTETYFGRRRYFDGIKSKLPFVKAIAERAAINAPIQGTEADVVKIAMIKVHEYIKENKLQDKVKMLLQVHDEIVFEIKESEIENHVKPIREIMENIIDPKDIEGVKLTTEVSIGDNWNDLEKQK